MKGHLKYAAAEYVQEADERGIRPISSIDCEIITELINILNAKGESKIVKILDKWKAVDDGKIIDQLLTYGEGIDLESGEDGNQTGKKSALIVDYLQIKDQIFQAGELFRVKTLDRYVDGRMIYSLLINGLEDGITSIKGVRLVNVMIDFFSEEQRKQELDELRNKLSEYRNCRFL